MIGKQELLELAERCEAAAGPDRELDALIAIELFDGGADHLDDPRDVTRARRVLISHGAQPGNFEVVGFSGVSLRTAAAYTASIDAGMTFVPNGAHIGMGSDATGPLCGWAWVRAKISDAWEEFHSPKREGFVGVAPFPQSISLALTAAALRARAATMSENGCD